MFESNFAKLQKEGTIKPCSKFAHAKWLQFGSGKRLSKLRYDQIENYSVETRFSGRSSSPDGPHLFWSLEVTKHEDSLSHRDKDPSSGFLTAIEDTLALKCATIQQLFDAEQKAFYSEHFATREEALAAHGPMLKIVRSQVRRAGTLPSELSQSLLAQLAYWCEQGWGRQTQVAKAVGATPQKVNDWLNGRKKMSGEQALRVAAFMKQHRK
jgi:hypothetical protein